MHKGGGRWVGSNKLVELKKKKKRILEWVAIFFSRVSLQIRDQPMSPALAGGFFITEPPGYSLASQGAFCRGTQ